MRTQMGSYKVSYSGTVRAASVALAAVLFLAGSARAESTTIVAVENPAVESSFTLDFGGFGGVASALIASTDIALEVDPDMGVARFAQYYQKVEALTLPGGFSTGDLTIEVVDGSSAGVYNELTREFTTEETYAIHFTGDLSAFGLESPVYLPGASRGFVTIGPEISGAIDLTWEGDGLLANPVDPQTPLEFEYTCDVATAFAPQPVNLVRLALVPDVINMELRKGLENNLVAKLMASADGLNRDRYLTASRMLHAFNSSVEAHAGRHISVEDADWLIAGSNAIIDMIGPGVSTAVQLTPSVRQTGYQLNNGGR